MDVTSSWFYTCNMHPFDSAISLLRWKEGWKWWENTQMTEVETSCWCFMRRCMRSRVYLPQRCNRSNMSDSTTQTHSFMSTYTLTISPVASIREVNWIKSPFIEAVWHKHSISTVPGPVPGGLQRHTNLLLHGLNGQVAKSVFVRATP